MEIDKVDIMRNKIEQLQLKCSNIQDRMLDVFREYQYCKLVDAVTFQVISAYSGFRLFDTFLTFEKYLESDKYHKLFDMVMKSYLSALHINLSKEDKDDFEFIIKYHANEILLCNHHVIDDLFYEVLPIDDEHYEI